MSELSGTLSADVSPVPQLAVPVASRAMRFTMHVLSCAWGGFVTGSGGPKRQFADVQWSRLHLPPGQSAFVVQVLWWFAPPEHVFPPASAAVLPPSARQVFVQLVTFDIAVLMSGTTDGRGTLTPPPPK